MAKKVTKPAADAPTEAPVKSTPARKTSVPPKARAAKAGAASMDGAATLNGSTQVTPEMIAERAYHLWKAGAPGSEHDHWIAAERELRGR